jgi:glycosyltransferase involved in cell wall biosynthesis
VVEPSPSVSVVVVVHDMVRELPRTLATLDPRHQVGVAASDYEVVVVDNGSASPVDPALLDRFTGSVRLHRIDPAPPSPARAANLGVALASGELVGVIVDGARMVTPGLVHGARLAARVADRPVITAPAYHLGDVPHMRAQEVGYDQAVEDRLLAEVGWQNDGYALFGRATFAGSSHRGWFGPMGESSSLFLHRERWVEVGGYDEAFDLPGGGLVNHDLYHRACSLPAVEVVQLLGEGTFHQYHGGAATSRRFGWAEMDAQYRERRGRPYRPPANDVIHLGRLPPAALGLLDRSVRLALERAAGPARG